MAKIVKSVNIDTKKNLRTMLGRKLANHLLTELLPLPTPSNDEDDWPNLYRKYYPTRKEYKRVELPYRINLLRRKIIQYASKVIRCYGINEWESFEKIFDKKFHEIKMDLKRVKLATAFGANISLTPFFGMGAFSNNLAQKLHHEINLILTN